RALFNPDLASRNFLLPGVLGLLIALITIMLTSMSVVKERESGTMEQIIVSPLRPMEFVAGKTLPFAIIGFADICVVTLIAIAWFRVPFNGSFALLLMSGVLFILSTLAVGLYISTVSRTQQQAMLSTFLFFVPAILFSGFVFPIYAMPIPVQAVTFLNPLRYFITIIRGIFLKGVGAGVLWPEMLALFALGGALLFFSVRRFSGRME
ncbi:MAG TPA: ABC transporter permease, partial [Spirochaetota bacterium]|nr:ABC transporter permease [Spirochaetota bacterium]